MSAAAAATTVLVSPQRNFVDCNDGKNGSSIAKDASPAVSAHRTSAGIPPHLWNSPSQPRTAFSSVCFDGASRVLPGRGTRSPTVESAHAAVASPFLRAQRPSPAESAVKPLATSRLHEILLAAGEEVDGDCTTSTVGGEQQDAFKTETVKKKAFLHLAEQQQQQQQEEGQRQSSPTRNLFSASRGAARGGGGGGGSSGRNAAAVSAAALSSATNSASNALKSSSFIADAAKRKRDTKTATRSVSPAMNRSSSSNKKHKKDASRSTSNNKKKKKASSFPAPLHRPASSSQATTSGSSSSSVEQKQQQPYQSTSTTLTDKNKKRSGMTGGGSRSADATANAVSRAESRANRAGVGELHTVAWETWSPAALEAAATENKLLFVRVSDSRSLTPAAAADADANDKKEEQEQEQATRIASGASKRQLSSNFLPVAVDWTQDPELAATYHAFASDQLQRNIDRNLAIRTSNLVSLPEAPSCFDIIALPDGRPIFANGRHLTDNRSQLPSFGIFQDDDDVDGGPQHGDFSIPLTEMSLVLDQFHKLWTRAGGAAQLRQQARSLQDDQSRPRAVPRTTMSAAHVRKVAAAAIDDFHFLLDSEEKKNSSIQQNHKMQQYGGGGGEEEEEDLDAMLASSAQEWRGLASSHNASLLEGAVQLLADAQFAFRTAAAGGAETMKRSSEDAGLNLQQLDDAVERATAVLKRCGECYAASSTELLMDVMPLEALATGATLEILLAQEASDSSNSSSSTVWIQSLRKKLATMQLHQAKSNAAPISRSAASSSDLVKVVQALATHASLLAAAANSGGGCEHEGATVRNELKSSLRLAVWVTSSLFERAGSSSTLRTRSVDQIQAWSALVALLRVVGYDANMCSEVLSSCCAGMVAAAAPLRQAWDERVKVTVERQWAQRSVPGRSVGKGTRASNMSSKAQDEISNAFSQRAARKRAEQRTATASTTTTGGGGNNSSISADGTTMTDVAVTTSFSTKGWYSFPPLLESEVDLDDARVQQQEQSEQDQQHQLQQQLQQHQQQVGSSSTAVTRRKNNISSRLPNLVAEGKSDSPLDSLVHNSGDDADDAHRDAALNRGLGLPVEQRQQRQSSINKRATSPLSRAASKGRAKQSSVSAAAAAEPSANSVDSDEVSATDALSLWRASNLVWAGAPRVDRGGTISSALRTMDLLQQVLHPSRRNDSKAAMAFSASLFSLRQLAAVVLTANSSRRGDCLATQGQLAGTVLNTSSPSTFVVSVNSSSSTASDSKFMMSDFVGSSSSSSVDVDATVSKFLSFLEDGGNRRMCRAIADTNCLSLVSNVVPLSVPSVQHAASHLRVPPEEATAAENPLLIVYGREVRQVTPSTNVREQLHEKHFATHGSEEDKT